MQTPSQRLRMFLDPENKFSDKGYAKLLSDISAPPKKPHHNNINCALLDFAKQYGILYKGAEPISGKPYHVFQAPKGVRWEDIDTLLAVFTHLNIDATVQHEKRPPRKVFDYQVICDETNNPPSAVETGNLNVDILLEDGHHVSTDLEQMGIAWEGKARQEIDPNFAHGFAQGIVDSRALRGMSRCATSEMLVQLEDDQMQFGLEALNNYLDNGIRPGSLAGADVSASLAASLEKVRKETEPYVPEQVYRTSEEREEIAHQLTTTLKPGEPETVATAYPIDLEERRASLAAENEQAGIGRGPLHPFEAPYGAQTGRVSCAEENPSTVPSTHEENSQKFFDVSKINPEFGAAIEISAPVTITTLGDLNASFGPADKALRQAELQLQADELNEFRREVGRPATVTPAYLSALSAAHVRSKQKKVKTKTKNRKKR